MVFHRLIDSQGSGDGLGFDEWVLFGEQDEAHSVMESEFGIVGEQLVTSTTTSSLPIVSQSAYPCSLWSTIPRSGKAYVSGNYVCFKSSLIAKPIQLRFIDIVKVNGDFDSAVLIWLDHKRTFSGPSWCYQIGYCDRRLYVHFPIW